MQAVSSSFTARAAGSMRRLSWQVRLSFEKNIDDSITFFTLDESPLDGPDVLAPDGDSVINLWDLYEYTDYSNRVLSVEWSREERPPASVSLAMADVIFDNHDNYFTPNAGSAIESYILPRRPIRIAAGFGGENVQVFVGMTEKMPEIDKRAGTATFHCIDFLAYLFDKPLDETVLVVGAYTHEVLDSLFQAAGLEADQYVLDEGYNQIPFFYAEKGQKLGDKILELMEAEAGRLYLDELGVIRFKNRLDFSTASVYAFDASNTIERSHSGQDGIINVVEVKASPRTVQDSQPVYQMAEPIMVPSNGITEKWADFSDPVTAVDSPVVGLASNESYFLANTTQDGEGSQVVTDIAVTAATLFGTSYKMTFTNDNGFPVWITTLEVWGTPAKKDVKEIYVRLQDDESVDKYEEHVYSIDSEYIQSESQAEALANSLLRQYAELGASTDLSVKGSPALQLGDAVSDIDGVYSVTSIEGSIADSKFTQRLRGRRVNTLSFFTLDQSLLDGPDVLAP